MNQTNKTALRICAVMTAALLLCIIVFACVAGRDWTEERIIHTDHVTPTHDVGNLLADNRAVEQTFTPDYSILESITIWPNFPGAPAGELTMEVLQNGTVLASHTADIAAMTNYTPYELSSLHVEVEAYQPVTLRFTATQAADESYFSMLYGDTIAVGARFEIEASNIDSLLIGEEQVAGMLVMNSSGLRVHTRIMKLYWIAAAVLLVAANAVAYWLVRLHCAGRSNVLLRVIEEVRQYSYLTTRLVSRNFNTKYRQSALGVLWSVLNPIFTMLVLYVVFSTLFQNNTENYIIYLFSGIIVWNFFTEAVSLGLESITGNASIINKVYVPRYIYPVSNVISALVNFLFALIPLVILCLITGLRITTAYLLLPVVIIYLFLFACGISFLLATSNVFFRDTRFLWTIVSMMWMYFTPIFYTESIIAPAYIDLYRCNPMYQFVSLFRSLVIQGVVPQPTSFIVGFFAAVIPLALGIWTFSRNQNRFVLYL